MSIADERRASGKAMVDARRASGKSMADDRRASGKAMAADRRQSGKDMASERRASGKAFRDDLRALADSETENKALPPARERQPIPAARGIATYTPPPTAPSSGGGIASPLTETDFNSRTYHETSIALSGDFLLGMEIKPIKQITMTDADGQVVLMRYADPSVTQ